MDQACTQNETENQSAVSQFISKALGKTYDSDRCLSAHQMAVLNFRVHPHYFQEHGVGAHFHEHLHEKLRTQCGLGKLVSWERLAGLIMRLILMSAHCSCSCHRCRHTSRHASCPASPVRRNLRIAYHRLAIAR